MSLTIPPGVSLSMIPALAPPHGTQPNFVDPASRAHGVITAFAIITAFMLTFVLTRMYTKALVTRALGWEDGKSTLMSTSDEI